jgi:Domain of unknown function (DUF4911)
MLCLYYQAQVPRKQVWFLVAILRSYEHLAFDRTLDKAESIFEFFVPSDNEQEFIKLMDYFLQSSVITYVKKLPHRLLTPGEQV